MAGSAVAVTAWGFSHPPVPSGQKVIKRSPDHPIEWHREKCPAPLGGCAGCAPAPKEKE